MAGDDLFGKTVTKRYLSAYEDVVREIERSTGKRPEPCKDLEESVLVSLFRGLRAKRER
ncbi:MAG: hypothetical protein HZB92_08160 [Euryarchaeota archaeon]|nr:hypothetical protein [Euryarchaeota archaeon]